MEMRTLVRKNGTVSVTESAAGWVIHGTHVDGRRFRMILPRCAECADRQRRIDAWEYGKSTGQLPAFPRTVCTTLHDDNAEWASTRTPSLRAFGQPNHESKYCHGNHAVRVTKIVELVAKTYGKAMQQH